MEIKDKYHLSLQFWNKVLRKNGMEFQIFFGDIMQKAFSDYQKIIPYGKRGDGGNDGYIPSDGIYFQVYSPQKPSEKEAAAAKKLKSNFDDLIINWDKKISKIKQYLFVFNDKDMGTSIEIEEALAQLSRKYKEVTFKKYLPKDLEKVFFTLTIDQMLELNFDIDSSNTLDISKSYLQKLEIDLDRDNINFVSKALGSFKNIILSIKNEGLILEYEILEARILQKLEKIDEAKQKYKLLTKKYPNEPKPYLYLSEIYLSNGDFKKNEQLLKSVETIDKNNWLLALEKLIREYKLGHKIDLSKINEKKFPGDPKIKSNFYRIYSGFLEESGKQTMADSFIEKAIYLNPDKISNYDAKFSIEESRLYLHAKDKENFHKKINLFLNEIEDFEKQFIKGSEISLRNQAIIKYRKFNIFNLLENLPEVEKNAKECFALLMRCHFDNLIGQLLTGLLTFVELPSEDFLKLLDHLKITKNEISNDLIKRIIFQYVLKKSLFIDGVNFFKVIKKKNVLKFIEDLKNRNYDNVLQFISNDVVFAVELASTPQQFPGLQMKIIESLPNNKNKIKEKLLLLLNYNEGNIDEAFNILKKLNLSNLGYLESRQVLKVAQQKKAWDFVIRLLENLLKFEQNNKNILNLKLELFTANFNLEKFKEVIKMGRSILSSQNDLRLLNNEYKENLLGQTIYALLKRGEFLQAKILMEKHLDNVRSFDFILGIKTDVYLKNNEAKQAISSIVEGIKIIKNPSPEQYGRLFIYFTEISNMIPFSLTPLEKITSDCFVKFKNQERWYFIGNAEELDATKIKLNDEIYRQLLNKKIGDKIIFSDKYRTGDSKYVVEDILSVEKYIFWQCRHHFEKLTLERRWEAAKIIEVPKKGKSIDTKYIIAFLKDQKKDKESFFNLYCQKNIPFAFLALNQGGLTNAIGHIVNENKGFIKFNSGNLNEMDKQKEVVRKIIKGQTFYIDGTSALVLSETGLLEKVYKYLPNLRIPQSVINTLLEIKEKFRPIPGQVGYMAYYKEKLNFSSVNQDKRVKIQSNFDCSIKLLESKSKNIEIISLANKSNHFTEQMINPSLSDACILAQRDKAIILTEDFLYLKANEMETKKKIPEYCSAFALIKELCEQKKLDFNQYLAFFNYLSSYRFKFLPITIEDIEKAITGDSIIKTIKPENIRLFNFSLTLSEDYGVPFNLAFAVISRFLVKIMIDDSIIPEMVVKIFEEIITAFPTSKDKKTLSKLFLKVVVESINKYRQKIVIGTTIQEKIDKINKFVEIYNWKNFILI